MKYFKKRGFWVFYTVMVLAGALVIVALGIQNQPPVIPDVNAQMNYSSNAMNYSSVAIAGSYAYKGSYNLGNVGSYASSFGFMNIQSYGSFPDGRMMTSESCGSYACFSVTYMTCGGKTAGCSFDRYTGEIGYSMGRLSLHIPSGTLQTCGGSYTCLTCSGYLCTGGGGVPSVPSMLTCSGYSCGIGGDNIYGSSGQSDTSETCGCKARLATSKNCFFIMSTAATSCGRMCYPNVNGYSGMSGFSNISYTGFSASAPPAF